MNSTFVNGRLTADPTAREINGNTVAAFTVACDTRSKDAEGNFITNFYRCTVWGKDGENCMKFLHKGERVGVVGETVLRYYTDKTGVQRSSLDIPRVDRVDFFFEKKEGASAPAATPKPAPSTPIPGADDDLPF